MKEALIQWLGEDAGSRANTAFVLLNFVLGVVTLKQAKSFGVVQYVLQRLSFLRHFLFYSRIVATAENPNTHKRVKWTARMALGSFVFTSAPQPPGTVIEHKGEPHILIEESREDLPRIFYFVCSALAISVAVSLGLDILHWVSRPFSQFIQVFTVWGEIELSWSSLLLPLRCIWNFLYAVILFELVYGLSIGTSIKSCLFVADYISKKLTEKVFSGLVFVLFLAVTGFNAVMNL